MEDTKPWSGTPPIVVFSIYEFSVLESFQAFTLMGMSPFMLKDANLQFARMLGTGSGLGFSLWPNWRRYATLTVHTDLPKAKAFLNKNSLAKNLQDSSHKAKHIFLQAVQSYGAWSGTNPFTNLGQPFSPNEKVAVLTRATIRPSKLVDFWRNVPAVSQSTALAPGIQFQLGIGELPVVQQATFSIWDNQEAVQNFAYRMQDHKKVVSRTRQRQWYSEELFARFRIISGW